MPQPAASAVTARRGVSFPASLALSPDCPGKLKQVQEWKTAVTKKQIDGVSK